MGSFPNTLGAVPPFLGVQHRAGGDLTLFPRVITPNHVHCAIVHVNRRGGHIRRAIARIVITIRMHGARSRLQNRILWWRASTNTHARSPELRRDAFKPITTPKPLNQSAGVGFTTQHSRHIQKPTLFHQPRPLQGFRTQLDCASIFFFSLDRHQKGVYMFDTAKHVIALRQTSSSRHHMFSNTASAQIRVCIVQIYTSQRQISLMVFAFACFCATSILHWKANTQHSMHR